MKKRQISPCLKVSFTLIITFISIIGFSYLIVKSLNDFEEVAKECDRVYGYTCSYYQVRQYLIRGANNEK